jgi:hypothetical protein
MNTILQIGLYGAGALIFGSIILFWGWMLIGAITWEKGSSKIAWVLVILFLNLLGAAIYFFYRINLGPSRPLVRKR